MKAEEFPPLFISQSTKLTVSIKDERRILDRDSAHTWERLSAIIVLSITARLTLPLDGLLR